MNRSDIENAARNIQDYYSPPVFPNSIEHKMAAFERARKEYVDVLRRTIKHAEEITFDRVFPKAKDTEAKE